MIIEFKYFQYFNTNSVNLICNLTSVVFGTYLIYIYILNNKTLVLYFMFIFSKLYPLQNLLQLVFDS